jgi:hypothetical protein
MNRKLTNKEKDIAVGVLRELLWSNSICAESTRNELDEREYEIRDCEGRYIISITKTEYEFLDYIYNDKFNHENFDTEW